MMDWTTRFPTLETLEPSVRTRLLEQSAVLSVPKDSMVFGPGMKPDSLLLLLEGCVRVQQLSENGREIVLYRVRSGETCVLTTACLLAHEEYAAEGVTESDVEAVAIPRRVFDGLLASSSSFRQFVFSAYSQRITNLLHVIEEVAFQRMDVRLAQKLIALADECSVVKSTHQQLAVELGSAREVISRQLQEFQRRRWIAQSRGAIELLDTEGLHQLAQS